MKKLKIGLWGASGRMGQEIQKLIHASTDLELVYAINSKTAIDAKKCKSVDVWIDFSLPQAMPQALKIATQYKQAYVSGTTGIEKKHFALLKKHAQKIPVLWSSNMSLGVAVLNEALKVFSGLKNFDFQIEEIHHIRKKDKPSGTALTLQQNLEKAVERKLPQPLSIRGGGVYGVHKIFALSEEEVITFEHTALNRSVFASGALRAARWIHTKKAGQYSMKDCLFED